MSQSKEHAREVLRRLRHHYHKKPEDFVRWSTPLELVIGTVLSAQCTDKKVNQVTPGLFKKYPTAADFMNADISALEREVYSLGFYKTKAKYLKGIGALISRKWNGKIPGNKEALLELPGISHKTANLIMAKAFGRSTGVAVDTHVRRIAPRLGLSSDTENTVKIAKELEAIYQPSDYLDINEYLILHGRAICTPKPKCAGCFLNDICPAAKIFLRAK